ncbi:BsuBI/PstI family type II restriction endonuclease [Rhizobium sp. RU36D]|uniref:BsuBI/PstI family type II restriction endonuclease n=1 Tax=Rhizobium sp. RU36D TaxID=1907415 RepID=UPI0009D7B52F|nr:BsuBI/PstI family type II restriction endonuclease [Rhizobium sp. RU36D]SMD16289.1 BsuBI/PstI restriction endonuclease C-terminus [Rhizobium sp. RU36D]
MSVLPVAAIQERLAFIFPEGTENRTYMVREMAARTVFTALYADAIEGKDRWIRPNQVCRMTEAQTAFLDPVEREKWYQASGKNGFSPPVGTPWFADTTREPIRDETIGEGYLTVRAIVERKGLATTSSKGRYALEGEFAELFDPELSHDEFLTKATIWRARHLSKTALARQALVASGAVAAEDSVSVKFPNGETRQLSAGPSSIIAKAVIEQFASRFLKQPHVLWLSESGNKVVARDEKLAASLGIVIDPSKALPDIILVDLGDNPDGSDLIVVFTEVVATDGPVNRQRKEALTELAKEAGFEEEHLAFMTAFLDRATSQFKKAIVEIAWGSYVWLVSEPEHIIQLRGDQPTKLSRLRES